MGWVVNATPGRFTPVKEPVPIVAGWVWTGEENHISYIVSAVKRVGFFFSDRVSHVVLRGRWCNIVLNVHAPSEDKSDDS
jgi:hypothetical protein